MQDKQLLRGTIRNEAMAVFEEQVDRIYEYVARVMPKIPVIQRPKDYDQDLFLLNKRIDLSTSQLQDQRSGQLALLERQGSLQRKLMSYQNQSIELMRNFERFKSDVNSKLKSADQLLERRFVMSEEQLKESFQRQNLKLGEYRTVIDQVREEVSLKLGEERVNFLKIEELVSQMSKLRVEESKLQSRITTQEDISAELAEKLPLLPKVFSKQENTDSKLYQIENYLDLYLPSMIQAQISENLLCYLAEVDRIKLALFESQRLEGLTEESLQQNGKGSLQRRMLEFRSSIEKLKLRNKKILENKLTKEDISALTNNLHRVDDSLVSRSKQEEEVRRITAEIESKLTARLADSLCIIKHQQQGLDETLNLIRREGEFNHAKYFDRAFDLEQKLSRNSVDIESKLQLLESGIGIRLSLLQGDRHARQDEPRAHQSEQHMLSKRHSMSTGRQPASKGECNNSIIRGILTRTLNRRFRFRKQGE